MERLVKLRGVDRPDCHREVDAENRT